MTSRKKQDKAHEDLVKWIEETEDPFGLDEEMETITFKCLDCGEEDEVPDFVVDEFAYDLEEGEQVEVVCPFCNGTMQIARNIPSDS